MGYSYHSLLYNTLFRDLFLKIVYGIVCFQRKRLIRPEYFILYNIISCNFIKMNSTLRPIDINIIPSSKHTSHLLGYGTKPFVTRAHIPWRWRKGGGRHLASVTSSHRSYRFTPLFLQITLDRLPSIALPTHDGLAHNFVCKYCFRRGVWYWFERRPLRL